MTLIARIQPKPVEQKTTLRAGSPDDKTAKANEPTFRDELRRGARGTPAPEAEIDDDPDGTKTTQVFARPNRQQQDAAMAAKELLAFVFGTSQNAPQVPIIEEPQVEVIAATDAVAAVQNNLEMALTPLEQAVHDLIGQLASDNKTDDDDEPHDTDEIPIVDISAMTVTPDVAPVRTAAIDHRAHVAPVAPMTAPEDAPEVTNTNLSHVNLVLEDGGERVVVTVAVRGTEVNVALRGSDDNTTAALARNAGTLDHAMRARGLDLNDFSAEPDRDQREQERPKHEQPRRQNGPAFTFEEPK
ncbi:MAG: hypothetical protein ABI867_00005 [Kofleriaceae bacterium]